MASAQQGSTPAPKKPSATSGDAAAAPVQRKSNFLNEVMVELRKTTWPTFPEAYRLTMVVLAVIVAVAVYVGAIDFVLSKLTAYFHLIK
jgi:preprotein translocase subunit SecE